MSDTVCTADPEFDAVLETVAFCDTMKVEKPVGRTLEELLLEEVLEAWYKPLLYQEVDDAVSSAG